MERRMKSKMNERQKPPARYDPKHRKVLRSEDPELKKYADFGVAEVNKQQHKQLVIRKLIGGMIQKHMDSDVESISIKVDLAEGDIPGKEMNLWRIELERSDGVLKLDHAEEPPNRRQRDEL